MCDTSSIKLPELTVIIILILFLTSPNLRTTICVITSVIGFYLLSEYVVHNATTHNVKSYSDRLQPKSNLGHRLYQKNNTYCPDTQATDNYLGACLY